MSTRTTESVTAPNPLRTRVRRVIDGPTAQAKEPTDSMKENARKAYLANQLKNKGDREEKAAREALLKEMESEKVGCFTFQTRIDGKPVTLTTSCENKEKMVIDLILLRSLVGDDVFMKIVDASKKSIEEHASGTIATRVISYAKSEEKSVKVSVPKGV